MFATLFKRAEQSVDSAIGDLGNRIVITIPFLIALGFAATSLTIFLNRLYGAELGTLFVAGIFCILGFIVALVVKLRKSTNDSNSDSVNETTPEETGSTAPHKQSIFDDETVMSVVSSAAPIVIPAMVRTGLKNWPILLAAAAGLYVASRPEHRADQSQSRQAPPPSP
jgi:hypothetical protein